MASRKSWLIATAVFAAVAYAAMWVGYVLKWAWLDGVDTQLLQTFHNIGATRPGWVSFWVVLCAVFGPNGFRVIGLVLVVLALIRRNTATAVFLIVSIGLMGIVTEGAKFLADRPRPATALAHASSSSFPSGHAMGVMVGVLALLAVLQPSLAPRWRTVAMVLGGALVILVGVGRVVLNVHHPSDVVAGWALGYLYYLLCLRLLPPRGITSPAEIPAALDTVR